MFEHANISVTPVSNGRCVVLMNVFRGLYCLKKEKVELKLSLCQLSVETW